MRRPMSWQVRAKDLGWREAPFSGNAISQSRQRPQVRRPSRTLRQEQSRLTVDLPVMVVPRHAGPRSQGRPHRSSDPSSIPETAAVKDTRFLQPPPANVPPHRLECPCDARLPSRPQSPDSCSPRKHGPGSRTRRLRPAKDPSQLAPSSGAPMCPSIAPSHRPTVAAV